MAVIIPIVTEFAPKGIRRAIKEFKQLEGAGAKAGWILKKAFQGIAIGAAAFGAAIAGAAVAAWNFAKAAAEDQVSAKLLAKQLQTTTHATDAQVASVEEWITQLQLANGVADSELRPNLAKLVRATKNVSKAQGLLKLALDVSAGSGRDLDSVVTSLVRAYAGNLGGLTRLGISLNKTTIKNKDFNKAVQELSAQFTGSAAAAADTFEGKQRRLGQALSELKETIGYALMPYLTKMADAALAIAAAFGKDGAAGAIKEMRNQLSILFYDEKGNLNAAGKQLNDLIGLFNTLAKAGIIAAGAAGGSLLGPIGALVGGVGAAGYVLGGGAPEIGKMPTFNLERRQKAFEQQRMIPQLSGPGPYGMAGVNVTVNVENGDPREIVRIIKNYQGQMGKVPMRTLNLGS